MNERFILNVLYGVFVRDTSSFSLFLQLEKEQALRCQNFDEMINHFRKIDEQLEFVYTKIEEDAAKASSQKVELLNITNVIYND